MEALMLSSHFTGGSVAAQNKGAVLRRGTTHRALVDSPCLRAQPAIVVPQKWSRSVVAPQAVAQKASRKNAGSFGARPNVPPAKETVSPSTSVPADRSALLMMGGPDGWATRQEAEGHTGQRHQRLQDEGADGIRTVTFTLHNITEEEAETRLERLASTAGVHSLSIGELREGTTGHGPEVRVALRVGPEVRLPTLFQMVQQIEAEHGCLGLPFLQESWNWRGHRINYATAGTGGMPVVLVHGFGGNAGHFRSLVAQLADDHTVFAVDLLGFGASAKPSGVEYGPELWSELVSDFCREVVGAPVVLVGNSIGSQTAMAAAARLGHDRTAGLVLLNCTGGMNIKGLTQDGWLLAAVAPIFWGFEALLKQPRFSQWVFNGFRSRSYVRRVLEQQVYRDRSAVTDQLVRLLTVPAMDEGATDVFVKVFTGPPGPRPESLSGQISSPMLVLWGEKDPWTPVSGKVAQHFRGLAKERDNVQFVVLEDVAHCPHDDRPELSAAQILPWLEELSRNAR